MAINVDGGGHWVAVDEAKSLSTGTIYIMDSKSNVQNADITLASRYSLFNAIHAYTGGSTPTIDTNGYLDLNGFFESSVYGNISKWGTADVYINGKLVADDVTDYCQDHPSGTKYEIKDIKAKSGYVFDGVETGSLSGTIGSSTVKVALRFRTAEYRYVDLNGFFENKLYESIADWGTADIYIDGQLVADDCNNYFAKHQEGSKYEIKDIKVKPGYRYDGVQTGALSGTIGTSEVKVALRFVAVQSYYLDLNGVFENKAYDSIRDWGTVDIYIDGKLVSDDCNNYFVQHPEGTKYEIKDIKVVHGYQFDGVARGALSGTIGTSEVKVNLSFVKTPNHELISHSHVNPSCTEPGTESYRECSGCGKLFDDTGIREITQPVAIPATGHNWDSGKVTKQPTETAEGVRTYTCTVCGGTRTETIPKLAHTHKLTAVAKVNATCAADGTEAYWRCSDCGKLFSDAQGKNEISAPVVIKATGHSWDVGKVTKSATCTEAGVRTYTCKNDAAHTRAETIPALGHDYQVVFTAPTCTEKGYTTHTCSRCGNSYVDSYVNALGHKTELRNAAAPSCTADGYTGDKVCTVCGEVVEKGTVIPAAGHSWDSGKVTKQPTETAEGVKTFTCTVCGETRTEAIPKLEPKPIDPPTPPTPGNPFSDVASGEYFYDPVLWAVNHTPQITKGTSDTTFSPDATCTRGQVVTFLWRAMGEPEPTSTANKFSDVATSDYFYKAVLWAVEKGITLGTSDTTFSPNDPCTRAHVVTFLWRAEGQPQASGTNPFADVASGQYYYSAVLWAVSKNITQGTSATTFSPDNPCTRAQIVTFLYRDMK